MSVQKNKKQSRGLQLIAGGTLWADCPIGTINAFGGTTAPEGWLICQGQALSRTEYKDLFDVIGTNFGSGDGSTTFNVPDLRGEFLRGSGTNSHSDQGGGGVVGAHQDATTIPYFAVTGSDPDRIDVFVKNDESNQINNFDARVGTSTDGFNITADSTWTGATTLSAAVRPTNTSVNFIMKAKQTPIPADLKAALEKAVDDKNILSWS